MELEGAVFWYFPWDRKPGVHQCGAGKGVRSVIDRVHSICIQPFCTDVFLRAVAGQVGNDYIQERLFFVLGYMLPCSHIACFKGIGQAVVIALEDNMVIFSEQIALLAADFLFFS